MPLLPQSNGLLFLLGGASVVAYLAYEYKEKIQMNKKFKEALAEIQSSEITTQTIGVESLVGYVSANKALIKDLCEHSDIFGELPQLIFSEDEEAQFAVLELMSIVSEDVQGLEAIKNSGLYSALLSFMAFPFSDQDAIRCALLTIRNSLSLSLSLSLSSPSPSSPSPSSSSPSPSLSGSGGMVHKDVRISPRGEVSGNDDYEKEEEWFARALYTQHGLEPVVNKLLLDDPDLQSLSLEIIIHYCRTLKNQDEIGELGGIGFMLEIFTSSLSSSHLKSLALSAIRYCVQTCTCNIEQFRKAGGIKAIVTYFKNNAPQPLQGSDVETQDDVFNALKILNTTIDTSGIETIRTDNIIPQLVGYFMQDCNQDIKNTTVTFLKQLAHSDPKCRREISDAFKRENRMGNAGVPPKQ